MSLTFNPTLEAPAMTDGPLTPGDLLVHLTHGVCRYQGTRLLPADGAMKLFLQLDYADGDRIFVPAEHIGRLSRHAGEDVELTRLALNVQSRTPFNRAKPAPVKVLSQIDQPGS